MRPVVPLTVVGTQVATPVLALVDSGCEHVLVAPWVAVDAGLDADRSDRQILLGIGGEPVTVRFVDAQLRLHPDGGDDSEYAEWEAEVGVVKHWKPTWPALLGQVGFMDQFTISMSRLAMRLAVDARDSFDRRYGVPFVRDR
ncbi:MAG: retropepsin-like domain-containing protein [Actinobacteria bacterium]|nr:retropepsin-like domain-containing protein [Actinomycetota bacterium]